MKKLISLLLMSMLIIGVLAACGSGEESSSQGDNNDADAKVLKMATSGDYAPFEYIDTAKGDDIIGLDIDIAKAITEELGYELEIQDMDFGGLISALQSGQADFVMAAMSATDERKESVDFSDTYYTSKHVIVSKKDSGIKSADDLKDKKVGAQLGSIQEEKAKELAESTGYSYESRNRIPELIQEILAGRLDAAIIEDTVAKGYLEETKDLVGVTIEDADGGYAIAFPKGSELREAFNAELRKMIENGEVDQIIKKWFDAE
ncbi:transporter substrate-binding domain-containing protein [Bacillus tuaregi]|uniref:transporter substrate-binding domain-containing protein n=1 Tax=Bacillus tuaregi TaxID=1816695 RepID=UPI0008F83063|nr:transporter substrate-binding domain-containing protein [Bacillus tuaregi]